MSEDSAPHVCQTGECVFVGEHSDILSDNAAVRGGCHVWSRRRFFAVGQDIDLPTRPVLSTTHVMCRASLVPIVCPASPHMRKGMACVTRHHDVKKWVSSWLDITSGVSNRTNRFRPHLPARGSVGEESVLRTLTGSPATSQHHEPASLPSAGIHNHTFAAERVHDV